ncbi:kelch repeat-containing protein [Cupriavidus sp. SW-Y-13]|uniref:kelch repeat-containing protein n=1 Tax=Cupriavidus sp. SW-Y-13 TaxID=2653854 RepID=UPI0013667162|nr:kelch repeat-containing protein [Cupriavidus sp. SW-Y-13]MWL91331.1 kelch-like protein [Cupriavidus sp. SW-Y-13]
MRSFAIFTLPPARHEVVRLGRILFVLLCVAWLALVTGCLSDDPAVSDAPATLQAPAGLSYAMTSATYEVDQAIVPNQPSVSGGAVDRYSVAPALPLGLALDAVTGIIRGTPAAISASTIYVVTAENAAGSATGRVQIEVRSTPAAPAGLAYRDSTVIYTAGQAIASNAPTSSGGPITSYRIAPALPVGLTFDRASGIIAGTPTVVTADTAYTVTGSNETGETTATLRIEVAAAIVPPTSITYPASDLILSVGVPLVPLTPSLTGGAATAFAVSPALPLGMSLNTGTGVIAGTPTAGQTQTVYTVTASNNGGSAQTQLRLTVTSTGSFTTVQSLATPAYDSTSTPLANGKVLVAGGSAGGVPTNAAVLFDPATDTWAPTPSMSIGRTNATATPLQDGRVLVVGGRTATAEIYDPIAAVWLAVPNMSVSRENHTATLLPDGRVLVMGGYWGGSYWDTAEIYDPVTNLWTTMATRLSTPRANHAATLLPDGNTILVAGGTNLIDGFAPNAERFPVNDAGPSSALAYPGGPSLENQSVALRDGKVLVIGAGNFTASLYDPATNEWTVSTRGAVRGWPTITTLQDGRVLVAGGIAGGTVRHASTEIYNPGTNVWSAGATMAAARSNGTAALLNDGSVLMIGGVNASGNVSTVERFEP